MNACQTPQLREGTLVAMQIRQTPQLHLLHTWVGDFHSLLPAHGSSAETFHISPGPSMKFVGCYDSRGSWKNLRPSLVPFKTLKFSAKNMDMEEFKDFEHLFKLDSLMQGIDCCKWQWTYARFKRKKEQKNNYKRDLHQLGHKETWD